MRKPPGGGGRCMGLWIGCLVCKRHTCRQVCYLLQSASPGKSSPSSVDKALDVKASELKKMLNISSKTKYVIPIPVITDESIVDSIFNGEEMESQKGLVGD